MNKFYCNICEKYVTLKNGKCPECKTDWKKIINNSQSDEAAKPIKVNELENFEDSVDIEESYSVNINDDINKNINFFLSWATIGKIILIIFAIIMAISALATMEETKGTSLFLLIGSAGLIFYAIIFENMLKWKAYMLYTNNKKKK